MSALAWRRIGRGCYQSITGYARYDVVRPDFAPEWTLRIRGRYVSQHATLVDAKHAAQKHRDDALARMAAIRRNREGS